MNFLHAIDYGLLEGITEYLPVSANGHLLILGRLLNDNAELVKSFGVAMQAAPMLAVLVLYHQRFEALFNWRPNPKKEFRGVQGWYLMALVTLPTLIVGFLFKHAIYQYAFGAWQATLGLAVGGLAILAVEMRSNPASAESLDQITAAQALGVGLFQCMALWPGISRSGATIIAGLLLGLNRKTAAEFSFLAGVPVFAAAAALEFHKSTLLHQNLGVFSLGFAVSFVIALLTVKMFIAALSRLTFKPFAWYRLAMSPVYWFLVR